MFVEHITVEEFKKTLDNIYQSTASPNKFYSMQDNLMETILNDLIRIWRENANQRYVILF